MKTLEDKTFAQFLDDNPTCMVMFGATWCGPCKLLKPRVAGMGLDNVAYFDVGDGKTPQSMNVRAVPTLIVFKDGKEVVRSHQLTKEVTSHLGA